MAKIGCYVLFYIAHWQYAAKGRIITTSHATWSLYRSAVLKLITCYKLDTRQSNNLYLPQANLTIYQKRTYYSGIKIFNSLPLQIREVADNQRKFEIALNNFLHTYSFYSIEVYLNKL